MSQSVFNEHDIVSLLDTAAIKTDTILTYADKLFFLRLLKLSSCDDKGDHSVTLSIKELSKALEIPSRTITQSLSRLSNCGALYRRSGIKNTISSREILKKGRDAIKRDIDNLLPSVSNYEELLNRLRKVGYTIKDKKRDGSWRKYITFYAPLQERGTRDCMLGKEGFYTRDNLTECIQKRCYAQKYPWDEELRIDDDDETWQPLFKGGERVTTYIKSEFVVKEEISC